MDDRERAKIKLARNSLWGLVRYVWPFFDWCWHHKLICDACDRLLFGDSRVVMIFAPPRHGKSQVVSVALPAFALAHNPHWEVRFSTNTGSNGWRQSRKTQSLMRDPRFRAVFPEIAIPSGKKRDGTALPANRDEFALVGVDAKGEKYRGNYTCSGVGGVIIGTGWDLGILDDPIEGEAHASSASRKDDLWEWFKSDFLTRRGPHPRMLVMHQRWCPDDLAGRLEAWGDDPDALHCDEVISLPAEMTEGYPRKHPEDPREPGEVLWPSRFSEKFLRPFRADAHLWRAMYQQLPVHRGSQMFDEGCWRYATEIPVTDVVEYVRFWDLSGTQSGDAWAGTLMARDRGGVYYVLHCAQWHSGSAEGDRKIAHWADIDAQECGHVTQCIEQSKADAGFHVIHHFREYALSGHTVEGVPVTASKEVRAAPYAKSQGAGNVVIVRGHAVYGDTWIRDFVQEHAHFPLQGADDRVDSAAGAWSRLAKARSVGGRVVRSRSRPRRHNV